MKTLINDVDFYGDNVKLVRTMLKRQSPDEYPEPFKWKLQLLYFDGLAWVQICRIDNYLHDKQQGSHIHVFGKEEVERCEMTIQDAEKRIKEIGECVLREKFMRIIRF